MIFYTWPWSLVASERTPTRDLNSGLNVPHRGRVWTRLAGSQGTSNDPSVNHPNDTKLFIPMASRTFPNNHSPMLLGPIESKETLQKVTTVCWFRGNAKQAQKEQKGKMIAESGSNSKNPWILETSACITYHAQNLNIWRRVFGLCVFNHGCNSLCQSGLITDYFVSFKVFFRYLKKWIA